MNVHILIIIASMALLCIILFKIIQYGFGQPSPLAILYSELMLGSFLLCVHFTTANFPMVILWFVFIFFVGIQIMAGAYRRD